MVQLLDIKNYLEIGVHNGASMSYVVNQNKNSINCYGIDLFKNTFSHYKGIRDIESSMCHDIGPRVLLNGEIHKKMSLRGT